MNYCDLLFSVEEGDLCKEVLVDGESKIRLTFKQLQEEVLACAHYLKSRGYQPGEIISTHLYNGKDGTVLLLAAQYIGCIICLIDPLFKGHELPYYIKDSCTKCLITHLNIEDIDSEDDTDIINIEVLNNEVRDSSLGKLETIPYNFLPDDPALILYTSGTTSDPKGVMLSNTCFNTFLEKCEKSMYRYEKTDRLLCFVPFSHAFGSVSLLLPVLAKRAAIVFLRSFHPIKVANTIAEENITHCFGVPTHYQQLLRYENIYCHLKKLKAAFCAAAPLTEDVANNWLEVTGIYLDEGYGISEATTLITTRMSKLPEPSGDIGFPPEGIIKVEVVDEKNNILEDGIIGELRVGGRGLMVGYFNRPDETSQRIRDGWLYTGDLGYRKNDGSFVICGRRTEFINVAGLKISPIEIEAVLNSNICIAESAVIGIKDSLYSEVVKAFVVLKHGSDISERELNKYLSTKLANFKIPKSIEFVKSIPKNNMGKIDKKVLKEYCENKESYAL